MQTFLIFAFIYFILGITTTAFLWFFVPTKGPFWRHEWPQYIALWPLAIYAAITEKDIC